VVEVARQGDGDGAVAQVAGGLCDLLFGPPREFVCSTLPSNDIVGSGPMVCVSSESFNGLTLMQSKIIDSHILR